MTDPQEYNDCETVRDVIRTWAEILNFLRERR
jgi:hypothetical protein